MKRIISREDEAKKKRRNQFIVGGILIFVMVFSTAGFALQGGLGGGSGGNLEKIIYNGFEFVNQNGVWILISGEDYFAFKHNPRQISLGIPPITNLKYLDNYPGKPLYIYSEDKDSESEISSNLGRYVLRMQYACLGKPDNLTDNNGSSEDENLTIIDKILKNSSLDSSGNLTESGEEAEISGITKECNENLPVKGCDNNFIIIKESNNTEIVQDNNCVFIYGEKENLTMLTDEFLFRVFGVRENIHI